LEGKQGSKDDCGKSQFHHESPSRNQTDMYTALQPLLKESQFLSLSSEGSTGVSQRLQLKS